MLTVSLMKLTAAGTVGAYHHSLFIFEVWASKNQMLRKDTKFLNTMWILPPMGCSMYI